MYLYDLQPQKKNVPELVKDPVALIKDVRNLVERHCKDSPDLAITGKAVLNTDLNTRIHESYYQPTTPIDEPSASNESKSFVSPPISNRNGPRGPYKKNNTSPGTPKLPSTSGSEKNPLNGGPRRRRTRCKICEACQRSDCGECSFCVDMVKFGGPGRAKQTCMMRQCLQPMLPVTAQCVYCHLDGWRQQPVSPQGKLQATLDGPSALMECSVCYEIAHPDCSQKQAQIQSGIVNEDLPNSWECPLCCKSGKNTDYKPRHFRARQKSSDIRRMSISSDASSAVDHKQQEFGEMSSESDSESPMKVTNRKNHQNTQIKLELKTEEDLTVKLDETMIKRTKSDDGSICSSLHESVDISENSNSLSRKKSSLRTQLAHQIVSSSNKSLKKPFYVVRPSQVTSGMLSQTGSCQQLDASCLLLIFKYLPQETLVTCSLVNKIWSNTSVDPTLWKTMSCSQYKLSASLLMAIVRRQPENLILDWTNLAKRQLAWVIARIPGLKKLSLQGVPIQAILGLHTCLCPPLQSLDLSFVRGLNDSAIRDILSPPKDSRPGLTDSKSRLRNLRSLKIAGTDISDVAMRYITQGLPSLIHLDLSSCQRITDAGVAQIGTCSSAINTLVELDLSSCKLITELALEYLTKCEALTRLDLRHVPQVATQAVIKFASKSKHNLQVQDIKLVDKRKPSSN